MKMFKIIEPLEKSESIKRCDGWYKTYLKHFFDVCLLIIMSPVILLLAVIISLSIWLVLGWPILFAQVRPGFKGRPFTLIKFRSMKNSKDQKGSLLPNEERLTRFGSFLRSTSLDELPEFVNVLRGHMSIVGPRPLVMRYLPRYSIKQMRRHSVLPGITGWAQVNGRNSISWKSRLDLDVWYVDNVSFSLDVKILVMTLGRILRRADISGKGEFSSSEFLGDEAK